MEFLLKNANDKRLFSVIESEGEFLFKLNHSEKNGEVWCVVVRLLKIVYFKGMLGPVGFI